VSVHTWTESACRKLPQQSGSGEGLGGTTHGRCAGAGLSPVMRA